MADSASKSEKERQLDEKIKAMRAKNAMAEARKKAVDKDKQLAESSQSSVTSVQKTKNDYNDPYTPPERSKMKQRLSFDDTAQPKQQQEVPTSRKTSGRLNDADGPPPDPGYRFLADRMREREEATEAPPTRRRDDVTKSREVAAAGRNGNTRRNREKPAASNTSRHADKARERKDIEGDDDDIIIVLEKDKHGRVQSLMSPDARTPSNRKSSAAGVKDARPKVIKSLLDDEDDDFYDYPRQNRWHDEPKGITAPRNFEELEGGKFKITRTVENFQRPDSHREKVNEKKAASFQSVSAESQDNGFSVDSVEFAVSEVNWQCSDPACKLINPPGSSRCSKCKLNYVKSREYKSNHACDKYKQEFNSRKPKPPQYLNGNSQNGMEEWIEAPGPPQQQQPVDMMVYGGDWTSSPVALNQWQVPQEVLMAPQYGMIPVEVSGFPPGPPPQYYNPRQVSPAQPYFPPAPANVEYIGNPYHHQSSQQFSYQASSPAATLNPTAHTFISTNDALPPTLFQTPPPLINASIPPPLRAPPPRSSDKDFFIPLSSPPKPMSFNRSPEVRKSNFDRYSRRPEESLPRRRLSDKNALLNRTRSKDFPSTYKPPSMVEMQSGSLRKGTLPMPPPKNKVNGLLIYGTSNVVNNLDTGKLSAEIKLPVRLIPAMKLETFEKCVSDVDPGRDWLVLIHGLGT